MNLDTLQLVYEYVGPVELMMTRFCGNTLLECAARRVCQQRLVRGDPIRTYVNQFRFTECCGVNRVRMCGLGFTTACRQCYTTTCNSLKCPKHQAHCELCHCRMRDCERDLIPFKAGYVHELCNVENIKRDLHYYSVKWTTFATCAGALVCMGLCKIGQNNNLGLISILGISTILGTSLSLANHYFINRDVQSKK